MLKLEDVLVNKVGSITILNLITSLSIMSGLTGNGQQCFEGDCAAGNCTMVVREEESVEVRLSVGLINISHYFYPSCPFLPAANFLYMLNHQMSFRRSYKCDIVQCFEDY